MEKDKFILDKFVPEKATDAELAGDLRLLSVKYATAKAGGETEFKSAEQVAEFATRLLAEAYRRGKMDFHPETMDAPLKDLIRAAVPKSVKDRIAAEKARGLANGGLSTFLALRKIDLTGPRVLAGPDGVEYGIVRFQAAERISLIKFDESENEHGYSDAERKKEFGTRADLYAYKIRDFLPFTGIQKGVNPYTENYFSGLRPVRKSFVIEFGEIAKRIDGVNVLEIGYGPGNAMDVLKNSGYQVSGIDNSEAARKISTERGLKNLFLGKAESLPFGDNSFDTVFSMHCLEHVGNIEKAIQESFRVAKTKCIHVIPAGPSADRTHKHEFKNENSIRALFKNIMYAKRFETLPTGAVLVEIDKRITDEHGIISKLDDMVIVPDYISLVGGYVSKDSYSDIDYVYRARQQDDATELLMRNQFGKDAPLHAIQSAMGPHGDHIPLYDLVAVRKKSPVLVKIQKHETEKEAPAPKKPDDKKNSQIGKKCTIFKVDEEKHLVYGAVYVPDETDTQGDWTDAAELEDAAHRFMVDLIRGGGRRSATNLMHQTGDLGDACQIVESAILPADLHLAGQFLPKGTWYICVYVSDPVLWEAIKSGDLGGFSFEGDANGQQG